MVSKIARIFLCFLICCINQKVLGYGFPKPLHPKPHVIIFLADDMGYNDVSFHGQDQILTPNIDALAYNGIILNRHYTAPMCTPTRSALLTGKYPINTGMQHFVIPNDEPWGLPLNETIMPQILKQAGYSTYIVGKWHQGFHKKAFTPTMRGFDYHFGYYGGYIDYYQHYLEMIGKPYAPGHDMRRNLKSTHDTDGIYATDLFTTEAINLIQQHDKQKPMFLYLSHLAPHTGNEDEPMQAPPETIAKFNHIKDPKRRVYAAMIHKLDESIGKVMKALYDEQILQNSIVLFFSDNGGPSIGLHSNAASNYPLRGQKESPWEGGVRTPAAIWSPYLMGQHQTTTNILTHVTDWFPTIAAAADIQLPLNLDLDGKNIWEVLQTGSRSPRWNILHNIDEIDGYSAYTANKWKYVNGSRNPNNNLWLGELPADEIDPQAGNYTDVILRSVVNLVLQKVNVENYMRGVIPDTITNLRQQSTVQCPKQNLPDSECNSNQSPCLFDIEADPCERYNLASRFPQKLSKLASDVEFFRQRAKKPVRVPADPNCDPRNFNFTWNWWQDVNDSAVDNRIGKSSCLHRRYVKRESNAAQ